MSESSRVPAVPDASPIPIRVKPVRGRVIDPYRGTPDADQQADRFAARTAEPQPIDDIIAALVRLPKAKVARAGRRFTLTREGESLKVAFASAARFVSLDDASWEGDPLLAIDALHWLLPLFGAVEIKADGFVDLIDGHEPADAVAGRYRTYWIAEALQVAQKLGTKPPPGVTPPVAPAPRRPTREERNRSHLMVATLIAIGAMIVGVWIYEAWFSKAALGGRCVANDECRSNQCLPEEPVQPMTLGGQQLLFEQQPTSRAGVCTDDCTVDADCPSSMRCGDAVSYEFHLGTRVKRCIPIGWDATP